ncbi:hypothetical protein EGT29_01910 [Pigmentiphaga sp. H8]|uniref:YncE family protein n=1 Tax=Pigmentiphaga sp. H8 TaxID=2488560 RepID=UPI000F5B0AA5|nr:hypothetical protein [Pigmentiphaga sp. H8]AZG06717.1 hypothetical protein EGT29_01910 [Pigmentiphaga sp. H8]
MELIRQPQLWVWLVLCVSTLTSCGGGEGGGSPSEGGGSPSGEQAELIPTLAEDSNPSGPRVDLAGRDYFPLNAGDSWVFTGSQGGTLTRRVANVRSDGSVVVEERDSGTGTVSSASYMRTPEGLVAHDPAGAQRSLPELYRVLPSIVEYPTPFYPVGGARRVVRQGNAKLDFDGDGKNDFYQFTFEQVFQGFKDRVVMGQTIGTAHFSSTAVATVQGSSGPAVIQTVTTQEDVYFAAGVGPVILERSARRSTGEWLLPPSTYSLQQATVNGMEVSFDDEPPIVAGDRTISLTHTALVYDRLRNVYYASLPSSVVPYGNRIAKIDPVTGVVSYSSSAIGSEPSTIAISADGMMMYVGISGAGDVARLSLPSLTLLDRVKLPQDSRLRQTYADSISVSPTDPSVIAVALASSGISPRHAGVALIRGGVIEPRRTQAHTGSNIIRFGTDGETIYGYNTETSEFGLRRIRVVADGLEEQLVVRTRPGPSSLDVSPLGILAGRQNYSQPNLELMGTLGQEGGCIYALTGKRIVCGGNYGSSQLAVFDATTHAQLGSLAVQEIDNVRAILVAGSRGQVAVSRGTAIQFIDDPQLD